MEHRDRGAAKPPVTVFPSRRGAIAAMAAAGVLAMCAAPALSQSYPAKPIRVVVPYPVGGAVDVMTRIVTNHMALSLGQPIVIENRPGANANLGPEAVAHAAPDGYTLLATATYLIANPLVDSGLRWSPRDFVPVARFTVAPNVLVVPAASGISSLNDFVAAARAQPGLTYGDSGPGAPQTMAIEMLKTVARLELRSVMYKGGPPVLADLMSNQIAMSVLPLNVAMTAIGGGRIKVLASTSNKRSPLLPDAPTMAEEGYPDVTVVSWYGFHAPAGTSAEVLARISSAVGAATDDDVVRTRTASVGGEVSFQDTAAFEAFLREDQARWGRFVQAIKGSR